ncbi:hypothetical protein F5Y15DRAFT_334536 [Xylariaceae sp. FL0016]|nr:hypothetical protein F5Y15DRAFT_334536 [Xylariaceae sp. FL0016]
MSSLIQYNHMMSSTTAFSSGVWQRVMGLFDASALASSISLSKVPSQPISSSIRTEEAVAVNSATPLMNLPPELLLCILEELESTNKESVLAFALTCKAFYQAFFPRNGTNDMGSIVRRNLLVLLERDAHAQNQYYCFDHARLHHWDRNWNGEALRILGGNGTLRCAWKNMADHGTGYQLYYPHARFVMNEYLYGYNAKAPENRLLSTLAHTATHSHKATRGVLHETWGARVVDGELFLKGTYSMYQEDGDMAKLRKYIDEHCFAWICPHLCTGASSSPADGDCWQQIPQLDGPQLGHMFQTRRPLAGSCPSCLTDYEVSLCKGPGKGWTISVDFYKQFGACRSPFDWSWRVMTEFDAHPLPRRHWHHAQGVVKARFEGASADKAVWAFAPKSSESCKCGCQNVEAVQTDTASTSGSETRS